MNLNLKLHIIICTTRMLAVIYAVVPLVRKRSVLIASIHTAGRLPNIRFFMYSPLNSGVLKRIISVRCGFRVLNSDVRRRVLNINGLRRIIFHNNIGRRLLNDNRRPGFIPNNNSLWFLNENRGSILPVVHIIYLIFISKLFVKSVKFSITLGTPNYPSNRITRV